jgi:sodium pump decarboxylase gamma subunit
MLLNLLTSATESSKDVRYVDNLGEAALYALLGFLVVFAGIVFLISIVWLVGKLMSGKSASVKSPVVVEKKETKVSANIVEQEEISEETIAVIMAALTAYYQANNPKCEFTLKRIKRM